MFSLREVMTEWPPYLAAEMSLAEAEPLISSSHVLPIPVCSTDRTLCGLITTYDFAQRLIARGTDPRMTAIGEVLDPWNAASIDIDDSIETALFAMQVHALPLLPVLDNGRLVGTVCLSDLADTAVPQQRPPSHVLVA